MWEDVALISLKDAVKLTSLSRAMINRYRADGKFPQAVPLGEKRVAFVRSEVVAWLRERIDMRGRVQRSGSPIKPAANDNRQQASVAA